MGFNAFLDIEGIRGDSVEVGHEGQVDILSYSLGNVYNATGGTSIGSSSGGGRVVMDSVSITKYADAASAELWTRCASGKKIPKMTLIVESKKEGKILSKLTYVFTDVYVSSIQFGGNHGGEEKVTESASFSFGKSVLTWYKSDDKNKLQAIPDGWTTIKAP